MGARTRAVPVITATPIASQIANQITKSFDGKSTRFDISLDSAGLGRVDVRMQIDQGGQVTASLSFNNPHAAAEAKSQAGQLQQALEQAGFNISQSGLSFDVGGQGAGAGQNAQAWQSAASTASTPTLSDAAAAVASAAATRSRPTTSSGVDITI